VELETLSADAESRELETLERPPPLWTAPAPDAQAEDETGRISRAAPLRYRPALIAAGVALTLSIWLFHFQVVMSGALSLGTFACVLASKWGRIALWASVALGAAFLAQATSVFVTPFTWGMRFGFFAALLGGLAGMTAAQIRGL
jgi:hypothetical protein